jgi:hypothetical protein
LLIVAIVGSLTGVPAWSVFVLGEREDLWIDAVMVLVGIASAAALWRWLAQPVDPEQEEEMIPALREAKLREKRRRQPRSSE